VSIVRTATRTVAPPVPAGVDGVEHSSIDLSIGRIDIAHPRDVVKVFYELNFGADGQEPPYWATPWPCGVELARAVARAIPSGSRVLELGCGLALPSMAAALGGAHVLATDQAQGALAFADYNARRNRIPSTVRWDLVGDAVFSGVTLPRLTLCCLGQDRSARGGGVVYACAVGRRDLIGACARGTHHCLVRFARPRR